MAEELITIRNKKTGEIRTVPRSQYIEPKKGFSGIGSDIAKSVESAPEALGDMIMSIPGGVKNIAKYAAKRNPLETLGNLGAGGVESLAGLLSAPQVLARYLAEKFPSVGKFMERGKVEGTEGINSPTIYESLQNFEKQHGLSPQDEEEASVRNAGGLLFGGKALTKLPGMLSRTSAITAEQAGQGGDPVHAALLGVIGDMTAKAPWKKAPSATIEAIKNAPEMAGKTTANALEGVADYVSQAPVIGKLAEPVLQPTAGALASYLKHISVSPDELAKRNLFSDIETKDLESMLERDAAAKRLGLTYLTPSELMESPFESVKQGAIGRTTKGMKELYKRGQEREASEEAAINKLFDLIHTEALEPEKNKLYQEAMSAELPQEFVDKQIKRPVIQKALKAVKNNTAYKQMLQEEYGVDFDKVPANSFMFWDMIKRVLYDFEKKAGRKGGDTESSVYGNTRRAMVKEMDAIAPEYETARNIAERGFTREELEKVFDKKDKTFNNFDSYLKSKKNYENLLRKLDAFPQAKQQLQDIKLFSGKMIPNNPSIRAAAALKRTSMSDARNALEARKRQFDEKYGSEHDVAAVKLMTNPDLMKYIIDYLNRGK